MDDKERRDRLVGFSIAVGTAALVLSLVSGAHVVFLVFAAIELGCLALYWPWYRRPLAWLRSCAWHARALLPVLRHEKELPASTVIDRWQFTIDGMRHPQLARMGLDGFGHPAYRRSAESTPPFVRVKTLLACSHLGEHPTSQDLRSRFLGLISHAIVMALISDLTVIGDDVVWRPRATRRRCWLEADLTGPNPTRAPVASAKLLLPEQGPGSFGTDGRCAELSFHVDLPQSQGLSETYGQPQAPVIREAPYWRKQFARMLALPGDLEHFLRHDLGLVTTNEPPAQFGIHLEAQGPLSEIVSPGSIKTLPAPYVVSEYSGYAIAKLSGKTIDETAGKIMLDLSERALFLDGPEDELSGLVPSGPQPDSGTAL